MVPFTSLSNLQCIYSVYPCTVYSVHYTVYIQYLFLYHLQCKCSAYPFTVYSVHSIHTVIIRNISLYSLRCQYSTWVILPFTSLYCLQGEQFDDTYLNQFKSRIVCHIRDLIIHALQTLLHLKKSC